MAVAVDHRSRFGRRRVHHGNVVGEQVSDEVEAVIDPGVVLLAEHRHYCLRWRRCAHLFGLNALEIAALHRSARVDVSLENLAGGHLYLAFVRRRLLSLIRLSVRRKLPGPLGLNPS